jgi:DNA-binding transcriptional LysR family regulator
MKSSSRGNVEVRLSGRIAEFCRQENSQRRLKRLGNYLMAKIVQWEQMIGGRLRLRDLFVFLTVVEQGSMAKCAAELGVSTPSVSETISVLEHVVGARILDRGSKGVTPTPYGEALLTRSRAAFDELQQGIRDIEFIADPTAGQVRIGAPEPFMDGLVMNAIPQFVARHRRVKFHVLAGDGPTVFRALQERKVDLVVSRKFQSAGAEEIATEFLFDEKMFVVANSKSRLARRRKIKLEDLYGVAWVMPESNNVASFQIDEDFRAAGVAPLKAQILTNSIAVRLRLIETLGFLTMLPGSLLHYRAKQLSLKILPVALPCNPHPIVISTLNGRTTSAVTKLFIEQLRIAAKPLGK